MWYYLIVIAMIINTSVVGREVIRKQIHTDKQAGLQQNIDSLLEGAMICTAWQYKLTSEAWLCVREKYAHVVNKHFRRQRIS